MYADYSGVAVLADGEQASSRADVAWGYDAIEQVAADARLEPDIRLPVRPIQQTVELEGAQPAPCTITVCTPTDRR